MKPFIEEIKKILTEEAAEQLFDKLERLRIEDENHENRFAFASAVLMLGDRSPSASVAMGVVASIEDTELFQCLALIGQALPHFVVQEPVGGAVSTVIASGLEQIAQFLINKANILDQEESSK